MVIVWGFFSPIWVGRKKHKRDHENLNLVNLVLSVEEKKSLLFPWNFWPFLLFFFSLLLFAHQPQLSFAVDNSQREHSSLE